MTLEQLRISVAVAERLHVTQAAGALNMTQSAVSAAIATLGLVAMTQGRSSWLTGNRASDCDGRCELDSKGGEYFLHIVLTLRTSLKAAFTCP